jgi:hypothetical protein
MSFVSFFFPWKVLVLSFSSDLRRSHGTFGTFATPTPWRGAGRGRPSYGRLGSPRSVGFTRIRRIQTVIYEYIYIHIIYIYILYIYVYLKYVYIYKYTYLYDSICLISWDRGQHNQIHQHSAFNLRSWVNTAGASCFLGKSAAVPSRTGAALQGRNFKTRHQFPQLQGRYVKDWVYMGEIRLSRVLIGVLRNHLMGMALWFNASL